MASKSVAFTASEVLDAGTFDVTGRRDGQLDASWFALAGMAMELGDVRDSLAQTSATMADWLTMARAS